MKEKKKRKKCKSETHEKKLRPDENTDNTTRSLTETENFTLACSQFSVFFFFFFGSLRVFYFIISSFDCVSAYYESLIYKVQHDIFTL